MLLAAPPHWRSYPDSSVCKLLLTSGLTRALGYYSSLACSSLTPRCTRCCLSPYPTCSPPLFLNDVPAQYAHHSSSLACSLVITSRPTPHCSSRLAWILVVTNEPASQHNNSCVKVELIPNALVGQILSNYLLQ